MTTCVAHHTLRSLSDRELIAETHRLAGRKRHATADVMISRDGHDTLRRAQDLLRHCTPNGDPAAIVERALSLLVEDLERKKAAAARRPRPAATAAPGSRHVPAAVKREVWARDEGRCAFVGTVGRCHRTWFPGVHHGVPFAEGGATDVGNLQLRCRAHNGYEAAEWFGPLCIREQAATYGELGPDRVEWHVCPLADDGFAVRFKRIMQERFEQPAAGALTRDDLSLELIAE